MKINAEEFKKWLDDRIAESEKYEKEAAEDQNYTLAESYKNEVDTYEFIKTVTFTHDDWERADFVEVEA